jgi:hypothetical protein
MKHILIFAILFFSSTKLFSQVVETEEKLRKKPTADSLLGWKKGGIVNIGFSQVSLTNWAAGGQSSIAVNGLVSVFAHKTYKHAVWENFLDLGYGIIRQGEQGVWLKTDDRIDFSSKYGQRIAKSIYFAGLTNFKTQWTEGLNPENLNERISTFMAPGYWLTAIGLEYKPNKHFSVFTAPFTSKNTFVLDSAFSNAGAFGVTPGKKFRGEFGGYVRVNFNKDIMENINLKTQLDLFSNYLNKPQNIDVNWDLLISMKVNKFITTTIGTTLIYDHDIAIRSKTGIGPRTQFKQMLSVGFGYKFKK